MTHGNKKCLVDMRQHDMTSLRDKTFPSLLKDKKQQKRSQRDTVFCFLFPLLCF